jgi:hypothetical protein
MAMGSERLRRRQWRRLASCGPLPLSTNSTRSLLLCLLLLLLLLLFCSVADDELCTWWPFFSSSSACRSFLYIF